MTPHLKRKPRNIYVRNGDDHAPFHLACIFGHFKIAEKIIEKSVEYNIDLNAKANTDFTLTHEVRRFECDIENRSFTYSDDYDRHIQRVHRYGNSRYEIVRTDAGAIMLGQ